MLHILLGPSGAGKTTLLQKLEQLFGWRVVRTITTRPIRETDINKDHISIEAFLDKERRGYFFAVQRVYSNYYGQTKAAIDEATRSDSENWVFDIAYSEVSPFLAVKPKLYLILASSEQQLAEQLLRSGRSDRVEEAIEDYKRINATLDQMGAMGIHVVYNQSGKLDETAAVIAGIRT